jgi:hypothetical protein
MDQEKLIFNHKLLERLYKIGLDIYSDGTIYRYRKEIDEWVILPNVDNCNGYNRVRIEGKMYLRHRIIGACYLGLKLKYNGQNLIDHKDGDKLNNHVDNLRIVNKSENNKNTNSKCYTFNKKYNKYQVRLCINGKRKFFGFFKTEDEARKIAIELKIENYPTYNPNRN